MPLEWRKALPSPIIQPDRLSRESEATHCHRLHTPTSCLKLYKRINQGLLHAITLKIWNHLCTISSIILLITREIILGTNFVQVIILFPPFIWVFRWQRHPFFSICRPCAIHRMHHKPKLQNQILRKCADLSQSLLVVFLPTHHFLLILPRSSLPTHITCSMLLQYTTVCVVELALPAHVGIM